MLILKLVLCVVRKRFYSLWLCCFLKVRIRAFLSPKTPWPRKVCWMSESMRESVQDAEAPPIPPARKEEYCLLSSLLALAPG